MIYEFEILTDVYSNSERPKLLTKGDKIKKLFDIDEIDIEEYVDNKTGKHIKKYCYFISNNNYYKINRPYEEIKSIKLNRSIPVLGFAYKSKKYK